MKIVKKGLIQVTYHGSCEKCDGEFEFDYEEVSHIWSGRETVHSVQCPTENCNEILTLEQVELAK